MIVSYAGPSVAAATSQLLGLVQYALLFAFSGSGVGSDSFFLLSSLGLICVNILVVGYLYPSLLRGAKLRARSVQLIGLVAATGSASCVLAGWAFLEAADKSFELLGLCALALALGSAVMAVYFVYAVAAAALGNAMWLSCAALPQSVLACASLLVVIRSSLDTKVAVLSVSVLVGSMLSLSFAVWDHRRYRQVESVVVETSDEARSSTRSTGWYLANSMLGYGGSTVMQMTTATLAASSLTYVSLVQKLVAGFGMVITNSLLPRLVNLNSSDRHTAIHYVRAMTFALSIVYVVAATASAIIGWRDFVWVAICVAWILSTSASASLQRVAFRFARPAMVIPSLVASSVVPLCIVAWRFAGELTAQGVLVGFCAIDLVVSVSVAALLKKYKLSFALAFIPITMIAVGFLLPAAWA